MKPLLRNAELKDFESIAELAKELGNKSDNSIVQSRLSEILNNDDNCIFVAVNDTKVIGWIHGFLALRIQSDSFVEIGGLIVNEEYWKKGVGKMLVECVIQWTESRNCKTIRVRCNTIRTESHKFYEKIKFKINKEQKVFDKIII
jgi:GNAT superfamily N-acetyltransferase